MIGETEPMNTSHSHLDPVGEALAERLAQFPDYRLLRALPRPYCFMPQDGAPPDGRCIALLDLETSSLDPQSGSIIEIAIKLLWVDDDGCLLGHFPISSQLEDPGHPLDAKITQLTGLRDADLAGKAIDDEAVWRLLDRADLLCAHNARFDAAWILQRWPQLAAKPWACSYIEVPWLALGFDGRSQAFLLQQHGWFARSHRAASDVWALFWLLMQSRPDPGGPDGDAAGKPHRTHLQRLLAASDRQTVKVEAVGAPYAKRHLLRARGYSWDPHPLRKVWWREVLPEEVEAEQLWFARMGLPQPQLTAMSARERHR
jgi:DNA polymerase-3 subunit epsilon